MANDKLDLDWDELERLELTSLDLLCDLLTAGESKSLSKHAFVEKLDMDDRLGRLLYDRMTSIQAIIFEERISMGPQLGGGNAGTYKASVINPMVFEIRDRRKSEIEGRRQSPDRVEGAKRLVRSHPVLSSILIAFLGLVFVATAVNQIIQLLENFGLLEK